MSGLFDTETLAPRKGYYAFYQFKDLCRLGTYVKIDSQNENIYACAATNGKDGAIFITHYEDLDEAPAEDVCLQITGMKAESRICAEFYLLDEEHNSKLVRKETLTSDDFTLYLSMKLFDTYLIKLSILN
jgi:hypothetical protein